MENVPLSHTLHVVPSNVRGRPSPPLKVPAGHSVQFGAPVELVRPARHSVHSPESAKLYLPALQFVQPGDRRAAYLPAMYVRHG